MRTPALTALSLALTTLLLAACQREPAATPDPAAGTDTAAAPATAPTPADGAGSGLPAYCTAGANTAPSGELVATRIPAADGDGDKGLYEGPAWSGDALYFSDFTFAEGFPSKIRRLGADGTVSTVVDPSGSNGLAVGGDGALLAATHDRKEISRFDLVDGSRMRIVGEFGGQPFNSPNDLVASADGTIWFTDPDYQRAASPGGQDRTRVYRVGTDGVVSVVDESLYNPNGIALSPDEKHLYVTIGRKIMRYEIQPDDTVANPTEFLDVENNDGLKVDANGNVFSTTGAGPGEVRITSREGKRLGTLRLPQPASEPREQVCATNVGFGDADSKGLYITACTHLFRVRLKVAGVR